MKTEVYSIGGNKIGAMELPEQFNEEYEPALIKRAILVIEAAARQAYGAMAKAGQGYSAKLSRRRRDYKGAYGKSISRVPRKTMWRRGMQFGWVGALIPGTVGGRKAHPPKSWKDWTKKINKKENKKAIRSALSGLIQTNNIIIVEDKISNIEKLKDAKNILKNLGLPVNSIKKQKSGKGRSRGRAIKYKKNPIVIVADKCKFIKAISNIPGYDVVDVKSLNATHLTLGHLTPRKSLWTKSAIEKLGKENLFK